MRDIRFRAWDGRRFMYSFTKNGCDRLGWFFSTCNFVAPKEQFTGLLDKNGKEIYEGDFVSGCNGSINGAGWLVPPFEIGWNNCGFNVPMWGVKENQDSTHWLEVIGNIHENPELREGLT